MKFEQTHKPLRGIDFAALANIIVVAVFIYLLAAKLIDLPAYPVQVAPQPKKITVSLQNEIKNVPADEKQAKEIEKPKLETTGIEKEKNEVSRKGNKTELGFELNFGTGEARQIKNFFLPETNIKGSGRVVLKLRFSIRPDGSVAKIFPLMKGNPDLELEAMNLLRKWRFEKLPRTVDQDDQKVEISFRPQ